MDPSVMTQAAVGHELQNELVRVQSAHAVQTERPLTC